MAPHPGPHATMTHHYTLSHYRENGRHHASVPPTTSLPLEIMQYPYPQSTTEVHAGITVTEGLREHSLVGHDWLQGHDEQLVCPHGPQYWPIQADEGGEVGRVANWPPRVYKFNPFQEDDDHAYIYTAIKDTIS
ncbi:hypothetical protein OE88DRAFT_1736668 [Heliocybe sulcata]|uniref:Uncharacterized protein n=1 Tax=Heliocybe sulcata TaxID=5364 RepID=A0A5C3MXQ7_9AGAM|nr:hypothetical protein OE88DRAFT_1736668 [Heliocybe sulcata]